LKDLKQMNLDQPTKQEVSLGEHEAIGLG